MRQSCRYINAPSASFILTTNMLGLQVRPSYSDNALGILSEKFPRIPEEQILGLVYDRNQDLAGV